MKLEQFRQINLYNFYREDFEFLSVSVRQEVGNDESETFSITIYSDTETDGLLVLEMVENDFINFLPISSIDSEFLDEVVINVPYIEYGSLNIAFSMVEQLNYSIQEVVNMKD